MEPYPTLDEMIDYVGSIERAYRILIVNETKRYLLDNYSNHARFLCAIGEELHRLKDLED